MDNQNKKSPEEQKLFDQLQKDYDIAVDKAKLQMAPTHVTKEFTFSIVEKRRLLQQQTIKIMVDNAIDDIINMSVLPRLGITPAEELRVLYDINLGRFTVFLPKVEIPSQTNEDQKTPEPVPQSPES